MKKITPLAALGLSAVLLAACSSTNPLSSINSGLSSIITTLSSPQATTAATNAKNFVAAGVCAVANASILETQIANLVSTNQAIQIDSLHACVASTAVCQVLGGTLTPGNCP